MSELFDDLDEKLAAFEAPAKRFGSVKADLHVRALRTGFAAFDRYKLLRANRPDLLVLGARPGNGKCLGKGTPVLMFDGTIKLVEDIKVDELLMGPNSLPRKVLSLARGREEMFRITPIKGDAWVCNRSHILSVRMSSDNGHAYRKGQVFNLSVDEYLSTNDKFKHHAKQWRTSVDFQEKDYSVEPYLYGLWLGDGTSAKPEITNPEPEIASYLRNIEDSGMCMLHTTYDSRNGVPKHYLSRYEEFLALVRHSTETGEKRISPEYLRTSRKSRLELLAGLLDTDGYLGSGCYEIITKSVGMCEDILFLARSLGFAAYTTDKLGEIKSSGFSAWYKRINISGNVSELPMKVPRKKSAIRQQVKDVTNVGFTVQSLGEGDYYGFEIDGDHLFLLGDFTVTHNTSFLVQVLRQIARAGEGHTLMFSLEMDTAQLVLRGLTAEAGCPSDRLHMLSPAKIDAAQAVLDADNFYVDDMSGIDINTLRARAGAFAKRHKIAAIGVDYVQIVRACERQGDKRQEVGEVAAALKQLAKDLSCPVVALAQMSRSIEQRQQQNKAARPSMSDLAECSLVENWADQILFLDGAGKRDPLRAGQIDCYIAKNRHGPAGEFVLAFDGETTRFTDFEEQGI